MKFFNWIEHDYAFLNQLCWQLIKVLSKQKMYLKIKLHGKVSSHYTISYSDKVYDKKLKFCKGKTRNGKKLCKKFIQCNQG